MWQHFLKPIKRFRKSYFPGLITASADNDPSGISAFSVIGATTGFSQLWLLILSTPLLVAIIDLTAHLGDITKKGLLTLIKENIGQKSAFLSLAVLLVANVLTLVADVIGMAAGMQLLTGQNYLYFIIPLLVLVWYVIVFDNYKHIARWFSWFSLILLTYIVSGLLARPDWGGVLKSIFWPAIDFNYVYIAAGLALFGTSISPYLLFWQTKEEIEERHGANNIKQTDRSIALGFIYCNLINFFIIVAAATTVSSSNLSSLSLNEVARALEPLAGSLAVNLFGLGLVGAGLLAIPVLIVSSSYAIAEFFNWPEGLNRKPSRAKGFYSMITFGFLICLAALYFNLDPIKILFYSQVLVGALTPLLIYYILRLSHSRKIMGSFRCRWLSLSLGWLAIILLILGDIFLLFIWCY